MWECPEIGPQMDPRLATNQAQIDPKSAPNRFQINPKLFPNRPQMDLWTSPHKFDGILRNLTAFYGLLQKFIDLLRNFTDVDGFLRNFTDLYGCLRNFEIVLR